MAPIVVTNPGDFIDANDGLTTLREAIQQANLSPDHDTITFAPGLNGATINLTQGQLFINGSVTIDASGLITIDGGGGTDGVVGNGDGNRIFFISGGPVTINGLAITGADFPFIGGAITTTADLTVMSSTIFNNRGGSGGGIRALNANVTVTNSTIADNFGGGINFVSENIDKLLSVSSSIVTGTHDSSGIQITGSFASATIESSQITENEGDYGGGVFFNNGKDLAVRSTAIRDNHANYAGGGLFALASNGSITIEESYIDANRSTGFNGGAAGAFLGANNSVVTITGAVISGNKALGEEVNIGGIGIDASNNSTVVIDRVKVVNNQADDDIGGLLISNTASAVTVRNSTISGNTASHNAGPYDAASGAWVETHAGGPATTLIENSTISDNNITTSPSVGVSRPNIFGAGLFIRNHGDTTTTILNSTISGNKAQGSGGGIKISEGYGGHVLIRHSTITNNRADINNDGIGSGAGINNQNSGTNVILDHTIVAGNFRGTGSTRSDISGAVTASWSLIGDSTGATITDSGGNQIGTGAAPIDPGLSELDEWGGPKFLDGSRMLTHRPLAGSPVIDRGNPNAVPGQNGVPQWDQRGLAFPRRFDAPGAPTGGPEGPIIDIGAVEYLTWVPGDYNRDGRVDGGDYARWRNTLNNVVTAFFGADGNGNSIVDIQDYSIWKANYGAVFGVAGGGGGGFYVPGDYNLDGTVNEGDYELWLNTLGSTTNLSADGNGNGIIDIGDLAVWQDYLGVTTLEVLAGDFNVDGIVDTADYDLWMAGDPSADANGDGVVDSADYDIWMANFGTVRADVFPFIVNSAPGLPLEIPGAAPRVIGVTIGGFDFANVVGSGQQLRSLPVANPNSISIRFSEEVFVTQGALTVVNLDGASPASVTSFVYDLATQTATWTFNAPLADGRTLVRLVDSIFDLDHNALDGEFFNPWSLEATGTSILPSGDGQAGGEFRFRFTVLAGDTDHDNVHGATDYRSWQSTEPGMIIVTTTADEFDGSLSFGDVSLREAVHYASSAGAAMSIQLLAGRYTLSRTGTETTPDVAMNDLDITGDVTIIGAGPGVSIIDNSGLASAPADRRSFSVDGPTTRLRLSRLTIANGSASSGAQAALATGGATLEIVDTAIVNHTVYGGAAAVQASNASLNVSRSVFTNNDADSIYGGTAIMVVGSMSDPASISVGESIFALNTQPLSGGGTSNYAIRIYNTVTKENRGRNLYDFAGGGFFDTTPGVDDYLGSPDFVVTSVADTFNHADDLEALSLREAIDLANNVTGTAEVWLPAWRFGLTIDRGSNATDTDVTYGDLDIKNSLVIRGIKDRTSIAWMAGVVDKVFDLLGDYNGDGEVTMYFPSDDWAVWDDQYGQSGDWEQFAADGDDDGDVDWDDETIWLQSLGNSLQLFDVAV